MRRLLIIDGLNLMFQMYYGMPSMIINKDGKAIHGTLGFTGALLKIIRITVPTHITVIFDGEHENIRASTDPDYKANRANDPRAVDGDTPFGQLDDVYTVLDFLGIKHMETQDCECDDVIASYVLKYRENTEIVIVSSDSDYFQLIDKNVSVLRYRGKNSVICDSGYIREKLGIEPSVYADLKSLTGDKSDNINGVNGIGIKTAAELIYKFNSLDGILNNLEDIKKPSVRASVMSNAERLRRNYSLIKLTDNALLPFAFEELEYSYSGIKTNEILLQTGLK